MNLFFTSDTHLGHANIIKYCKRPFATADEMDEAIIRNWNARVGKKDIVYHLGDFCWGNFEKWKFYRSQLNGAISLIFGNHDNQNAALEVMDYANDYLELSHFGKEIILFHYGLRTWHHDLRGTWHLYGHSHNQLPPYGKSMDIGVDCWGFKPLSFDEVRDVMDKRPIGAHPAFEEFNAEQARAAGQSQLP